MSVTRKVPRNYGSGSKVVELDFAIQKIVWITTINDEEFARVDFGDTHCQRGRYWWEKLSRVKAPALVKKYHEDMQKLSSEEKRKMASLMRLKFAEETTHAEDGMGRTDLLDVDDLPKKKIGRFEAHVSKTTSRPVTLPHQKPKKPSNNGDGAMNLSLKPAESTASAPPSGPVPPATDPLPPAAGSAAEPTPSSSGSAAETHPPASGSAARPSAPVLPSVRPPAPRISTSGSPAPLPRATVSMERMSAPGSAAPSRGRPREPDIPEAWETPDGRFGCPRPLCNNVYNTRASYRRHYLRRHSIETIDIFE